MTRFTKIARCLLVGVAAALVLFCSASCNGGNEDDTTEAARFLTDIFSAEKFSVSDNFRMNHNATPYYDAESETVTLFSVHIKDTESDGEVVRDVSARLTDFGLDGTAKSVTALKIPDSFGYAGSGTVTKDYFYYASSRREYAYSDTFVSELFRFDRNTGETISNSSAFDNDFAIRSVEADRNGLVYCTDYSTVYVFDPDLSIAFTYDFPQTVYTMATGADGNVWVTFNAGMESCAAIIDPDTGMLGEYHKFTRGSDTLEQTLHYLINAPGNADFDFCYYDKQNALWSVTVSEDGSLVEEKYMDLYNSGISRFYDYYDTLSGNVGMYAAAVLSEDVFLAARSESLYYSCPVIYTRAEDVDLSNTQTLTVAYAYSLEAEDVDKINDFNAAHPELTVVMEDYSKYATDDDSMAGEEKLCFDILHGFIRPDIVISSANSRTLSDRAVAVQLVKNGLYTDLTPYLEKDDTVNFDTLFGCIPRMFDDGNGGIWGISTSFSYNTMVGNRELLGEYAEKGSFTLEEMFAYFDSLPEGTEYIYESTSSFDIANALLQNGYNYFMTDERDFTSEAFLRCLERQKSLPFYYNDWKRESPNADIGLDNKKLFAAISAGRIGLARIYIGGGHGSFPFTSELKMYLSDEYCHIGYATDGENGSRVGASYFYAITSLASDTDVCFELIASFFDTDKYGDYTEFSSWELPSLKTQFDVAVSVQGEYSDGEYRVELTADEISKAHELFDNAGGAYLDRTSRAVYDIVEEEVSAYCSGMGTSSACGEKIRSRVDIWQAEHE